MPSRWLAPQDPSHGEPVHIRKPDVQQHHVWTQRRCGGYGTPTVGGLPHDLAPVLLQQQPRHLPETGVIIDDEDRQARLCYRRFDGAEGAP